MRKWCLEEMKRIESSLREKRVASIQFFFLARFFSVYRWEVEKDQKIRWETQILLLLLFLSCCTFYSTIFLCYLFISFFLCLTVYTHSYLYWHQKLFSSSIFNFPQPSFSFLYLSTHLFCYFHFWIAWRWGFQNLNWSPSFPLLHYTY